MVNKVRSRLDSYLGFDSNDIFKCGDPLIFGGSLRDSIAEMDIYDVDIVGGPDTIIELHELLTERGYNLCEGLVSKGVSDIYRGLHRIMSEPKTYVNGNGSVVQLIRPVASPQLMSKYPSSKSKIGSPMNTFVDYVEVCDLFVKEVDISCCGISYNGEELKESYPNSILHSESRVFIVNHDALMKTNRLRDRISKLISRHWLEITKDEEREFIIDVVLD